MTPDELIFTLAVCALFVVIPLVVCSLIDIRHARRKYPTAPRK
jgi:hypothetical protein